MLFNIAHKVKVVLFSEVLLCLLLCVLLIYYENWKKLHMITDFATTLPSKNLHMRWSSPITTVIGVHCLVSLSKGDTLVFNWIAYVPAACKLFSMSLFLQRQQIASWYVALFKPSQHHLHRGRCISVPFYWLWFY